MKYTKRAMLGAIAACAMFTAAPAYADLKLGVAAEPYAPFTSKDASGVWVGWEVDFMNALCAEIGEKCTIEEVAWDGIIPALHVEEVRRHHVVHVGEAGARGSHQLLQHLLQFGSRPHRPEER